MSMSVLALPRVAKRLVAIVVDTLLCVFTVWVAFYLRLGELVSLSGVSLIPVIVSVIIALPVFLVFGLYRAIFRYSGWPALMAVTRAVGLYGAIYASVFTAIGIPGVPRTIGIIQPILLLLAVGTVRACVRLWLGDKYKYILKRSNRPKVLIYGTGQAGRQLAAAIADSVEMQVKGFIDDDVRLHRHTLNGLTIYNPKELDAAVTTLGISSILLALPQIDRKRRNEILALLKNVHVSVRTLPSVSDLVSGKVGVADLRELDVDDLLGREATSPDPVLLSKSIVGKVVLVTGAGGSIGSELCRQIVSIGPSKLLMLEQSEFALYEIHQRISEQISGSAIQVIPLLASVQDRQRMREIMSTWSPTTVYHAAAYKHVPLVEQNPAEGVKNNLFGTLCAAQVAIEAGVSDFVLISTDKAVRPTNIMGASKRLAEMSLQALAAERPRTNFAMVRFGNVLGSSGSVVPKFRQQIRNGGPLTLTHPEVTRYFMTIPEAAQLVIQAGAMANGGDVFVLDMGKPVKIADLARRMVELSGLTIRDASNPQGDIRIDITGLRPGEKLYEELLIGNNPTPTPHPRIMKAHEDFIEWDQLKCELSMLAEATELNSIDVIRSMMERLVTGYTPASDIADLVYREQKSENLTAT